MKNKGITLVALVVTIIIMLILAGVALRLTLGDNGLIKKAKETVELYKKSQNEEEESLQELENKISGKKDEEDEIKEGKEDKTPGQMTGEGTKEKPFLIQSIEDLVYLSEQVGAGIDYKGKEIKLMVNLDFQNDNSYVNPKENKEKLTTGGGFPTIGDEENIFKGNFDGNNHIISNLYINNNSELPNQGLFAKIENCEIKNLTVKGSIQTSVRANIGIIGSSIGTNKITNLTNEMSIKSEAPWYSVGGIVGALDNGTLTIENCINKGTIENGNNVGGIVGYSNGNITIKNCSNEGTVTNKKGSFVGGILGRDNTESNKTIVLDSHNTGLVSSNKEEGNIVYIGGIIGLVNGTVEIEKCYNSGEIKNEKNEFPEEASEMGVGGLIGFLRNGDKSVSKIINSYNTNNITNGKSTGGIIGYNCSSNTLILDRCYNTGKIEIQFELSKISAGGLVGPLSTSSETYILNSYNLGSVSNNGTMWMYSGGIAPFTNQGGKSTILNCYNAGAVYGPGGAQGINYAVNNDDIGLGIASVYINNAYNIGEITGNGINGIVTIATGCPYDVKNIYCDNRTMPSNISGLGISMELSEMKTSAFVNTLNSNRSQIDLKEINEILTDYSLLEWKQGSEGYPVFDIK